MYNMNSWNLKTSKMKNMRWYRNKGTQRRLQQTSKWNKGHYKKGDIWIKVDNTKHKIAVEQRYGKLQKKESTEILEIKIPLVKKKKTH
jgi:hypothetical protein